RLCRRDGLHPGGRHVRLRHEHRPAGLLRPADHAALGLGYFSAAEPASRAAGSAPMRESTYAVSVSLTTYETTTATPTSGVTDRPALMVSGLAIMTEARGSRSVATHIAPTSAAIAWVSA